MYVVTTLSLDVRVNNSHHLIKASVCDKGEGSEGVLTFIL